METETFNPINYRKIAMKDHTYCACVLETYPNSFDIYAQDGPSDEILLVNRKTKHVIMEDVMGNLRTWDNFYGLLKKCGWRKIGKF